MKKKASHRAASIQPVRAAEKARKTPRRPTNLTLDPEAVERGERFSRRQGTSLSSLVTSLLYALPDDEPSVVSEPLPPAVARLYGVAAGAAEGRDNYRAHVLDKYGRDR